jgi:acyl-CoA thioesterase-1
MNRNLYLRCEFFVTTIFAIVLAIAVSSSTSFAGTVSPGKSDFENNDTGWPSILVLGDSLSASFGIEKSQGWVSLLELRLAKNNYQFRVVNVSISGETTQGGLQRLPKLLFKHKPAIVIVELGGNDGLRGLNLSMIKVNLFKILSIINKANASPLLISIRLPPNYGLHYTERFHQVYLDLANEVKTSIAPFLLKDIATNESLMQSDGIHPTANAQPAILNNVWQALQPMIKDMGDKE